MPGHIGAYEWMWDGSYEGQDAGQRFDAAFTAMVMVDYYDFSLNRTFLQSIAYPFVRLTVNFLESYVRNDTEADGSYSLHIHHACAQEGCVGQPAFPSANESRWAQKDYGDTTPDLAFFKYALRAAIRLSEVLGVDQAKRRDWAEIVGHLPTYQTLSIAPDREAAPHRPAVPGTVFAQSANYTQSPNPYSIGRLTSYAIVFTAAMYPATDPDVANDASWRKIGVRTLRNLPLVPYNGAQQIWNAMTRVGYDAELMAEEYGKLLEAGVRTWPNFRVDFGSSNGFENSGVLDALNDMLMQSWRGMIELFPCYPRSMPGHFAGLRARGAFLVSASVAKGSGLVSGVRIASEAGARCLLRSPWAGGGSLTVVEEKGGARVEAVRETQGGVEVWAWPTRRGEAYLVHE